MTVICCRVSPIQKAEMVELVQEHTNSICLAIGDGANDVAMIQKAHVGVGISGNEGLQATNSSDFAIAQFRFLSRLLFLHGAWFYTRIAKLILYSFYKNIVLYIIELWFAMYNYWTGQVLFERWTIGKPCRHFFRKKIFEQISLYFLGLYNLFMTSAPPVAIGLFDRHCLESTRMKNPALYRATQKSDYFNHKVFWKWIGNAIFHSIILYWVPLAIYGEGNVWNSGRSGGYLVLGNIVYSCVMITVCFKAALELISWNWFCHMAIWGSVLFWFAFLAIYSYVWPIGISLAPNMAGMIELITQTPMSWTCFLLVPFTALIPDIVLIVVGLSVFPSETDRVRMAEANQDSNGYLSLQNEKPTLGQRLCGGNNKLIINIRNVFAPKESSTEPEEHEMNRGYAFSEEEGGAISKTEYIRRYDTTKNALGGT